MTEPIVRLTDVRKTAVVQQNLLQDERGHSFTQLGAALHDAQAKRNDLRGEQKRNYLLLVGFYQRSNHSQTRQSEILERTRLADRV